MQDLLRHLHFENGLIPAVIVEAEGGEVLTLCYMNEEALRETLRTRMVHVYRRSRGRVMKKGEVSGHTQEWRELRIDCDGNSLLFVVQQHVAACHQGYRSCYFRRYDPAEDDLQVAGKKVFEPANVYREGTG